MQGFLCERYGPYRDMRFGELPPPTLRPGCVRIAVHYATAGFGQTLVIAGRYQRKPPLPFVPGTEVSGVVMEVAPDVVGFSPGDRVAAALDWGGFATEAVATAATTWHVPDGVDLATAATVPLTYGTAYAALHWRARLQAGETLLVYGAAGGVGLPAVEVARLAGAEIVAVAGSPDRVRIAMDHGAAHGIVHSQGEAMSRQVMGALGGRRVDVVFDTVGGELFDEALRCVQPEGRVLVVGFAGGTIPQIPANILLIKNIDVIGFNFGLYVGWTPLDERERFRDRMRVLMDTLFAHVVAGELKPTSSVVYPLPQLADAFDAVIERRAVGRALVSMV
ncbi:NADPH:quinone oxidoreductase family protein [Ramlibacter sp.]|uniref:NADPH:quinone oxidoreductase family protein n=1 Tax=Ramlibacter sp. TaxID=1917967 RepID=UPI003D0F3F35